MPFLHALAVPPLTVLGWIFIAGAFGLLFYLTYALTIGVGDIVAAGALRPQYDGQARCT